MTLTVLEMTFPLSEVATHRYPAWWTLGRNSWAGNGLNHSEWLPGRTSLKVTTLLRSRSPDEADEVTVVEGRGRGVPSAVCQVMRGAGRPRAEQWRMPPVCGERERYA